MVGARAVNVGPRRFEHAITWSRLVGALAVLVIGPVVPNLGGTVLILLAGALIASAIVLDILATRMRTRMQVDRLSWIVFGWDVLIVGLAQLAMTPSDLWPAIVLIGVLLIISTAFRLGEVGATVAAAAEIAVVLVLALWRRDALGIATPWPFVAFDVVMFFLAALLMSSMLREVGFLRRERTDLLRQVGDVDALRESTERHERLLEHEREARTAAELAVTRLEAVRHITDSIIRTSSIDDLLSETLAGVAKVAAAQSVVILGATDQGATVRAAFGLEHSVRRALALEGDLGEAMTADKPVIVLDNSTTPLDAHATERIESRILLPLAQSDGTKDILYIGFARAQDFGRDDLVLLGLIAERIGIALERVARSDAERRAREAAETAVQRSQLLLEAADVLVRARDGREALDGLVDLAVPRLADWCVVYERVAEDELVPVALAAADADLEKRLRDEGVRTLRPSSHPLWSVMRDTAPRSIERIGPEDLVLLAESSPHLRMLLDASARSWMAVPLLADGRLLGAVELYASTSGRAFTASDVTSARSFATHVAVALDRLRAIR